MRHLLLAFVLAAMLLAVPVGSAGAAPTGQACTGPIRLDDIAGIYINQASPMRLDIAPCGGMMLTWDNVYGRHRASYGVTERFPGGSFVALGIQAEPFGAFLDDGRSIGVSPAEPGWIKIITVSPYLNEMRWYRLEKML